MISSCAPRKPGRPNTEFRTGSASGPMPDLTLRAETVTGTDMRLCWSEYEFRRPSLRGLPVDGSPSSAYAPLHAKDDDHDRSNPDSGQQAYALSGSYPSNGSPESDGKPGFTCAIAFRYNGLQRWFDADSCFPLIISSHFLRLAMAA